MNNEPVAWMTAQGIQDVCTVNEKEEMGNDFDDYTIPLYTHPAKTLTLTDDEVEEFEWVLKKHFNFPTNKIVPNLDKIIRAILKKASEK
jgi:hypothetical protein